MIAVTLGQFSAIIVILVGILTILGTLWRTVRKASGAVMAQLEATKENTRAVRELSTRVTKLEQGVRRAAEG